MKKQSRLRGNAQPASDRPDLISKLQELSESALTREVVGPLLKSFGFSSIDHHGGPYEIGKDVIAWRLNELGERELAVVQVKLQSPGAKADSKNSFGGLITQLQQAAETPVEYTDGQTYFPSHIYFITPNKVDTRALQSRFHGYQSLRHRSGLKIIDGDKLVELLSKNCPDVVSRLVGDQQLILTQLLPTIANNDLLGALNALDEQPDIFEIYCDLEFGIGRITTQLFFDIDLRSTPDLIFVDSDRWPEVRRKLSLLDGVINGSLMMPLDSVERAYEQAAKKFDSKANQKRERRISQLSAKVGDITGTLRLHVKRLNEILGDVHERRRWFSHDNLRKISEFLESLNLASNDIAEIVAAKSRCSDFIRSETHAALDGLELLKELRESLGQLHEAVRQLVAERESRAPAPRHEVRLNVQLIQTRLTEHKALIRRTITSFNKRRPSLAELRKFVLDSNRVFNALDECLSEPSVFLIDKVLGGQRFVAPERLPRFALSVHDVFDSGVDVCVLGEAGAGKSTTLHMYAHKCARHSDGNQLVLYLPLARVASSIDPAVDKIQVGGEQERLFDAILAYLVSRGVRLSEVDFARLINDRGRVVFIFDGLDEIIERCPWVVEAMQSMKSRFPKSQLIISSRMSGDYLHKIRSVGLTLMPFTDEQRDTFIRSWFGASHSSKSEEIIEHLQHPANSALANVVRNPLLSTVVCVLGKQNVPLPGNEIGLYEERMRLLLGHYDQRKGIKRVKSHHSLLDACARKLAYFLHQQHVRQASMELLMERAVSRVRQAQRAEVEAAVRELVDPCNILVPMTESGAYGFGHLRYQEYLAACEIKSNRGIELEGLLRDSWWKDAMVLFAQMTDGIEQIIDQLVMSRRGPLSRAAPTLKAMIAARPVVERSALLGIVQSHEKLDEQEGWVGEPDDLSEDESSEQYLGVSRSTGKKERS
jgi:hypothetical protein